MMLVTCEPLEGEFACLCRALTSGRLFVKAQGHLDLHLGREAYRMDVAPHLLGQLDDRHCLWRHERRPWRSRASRLLPNVWPWKPKTSFLGLDITSGARAW
jgi:hypothetical protein